MFVTNFGGKGCELLLPAQSSDGGEGHLVLWGSPPPSLGEHPSGWEGASSQPLLGCAILGATSCLPSLQLRAQFGGVLGIFTTQSGRKYKPIHLSLGCRSVSNSGLQLKVCSGFPFPCSSFYSTFPSHFTFLFIFSLYPFLFLFHKKTPTRPVNQVLCFHYLHPSPFLVQCRKPCSGCKRAFPPLFFPFPWRFYLPLPLLSLVSHL